MQTIGIPQFTIKHKDKKILAHLLDCMKSASCYSSNFQLGWHWNPNHDMSKKFSCLHWQHPWYSITLIFYQFWTWNTCLRKVLCQYLQHSASSFNCEKMFKFSERYFTYNSYTTMLFNWLWNSTCIKIAVTKISDNCGKSLVQDLR